MRADGSETFRLEVIAGTSGAVVTLESVGLDIIAPGQVPLVLRDNGAAPDRVGGDGIYTTGPFALDPEKHFFAPTYLFDPDSPTGVDVADVGTVRIDPPGAEAYEFLLPPRSACCAKISPPCRSWRSRPRSRERESR